PSLSRHTFIYCTLIPPPPTLNLFPYTTLFRSLICLLSTTHIYSQNNQAKKTTTLYTYTFSGEMNASSITQMETALQQLTNVTEVKVKYKEEKQQGQLMVIVKELPRKSEGDILFEPI